LTQFEPRRFRLKIRRNRTLQRTDGFSASAGTEVVVVESEAAWLVRNRIADVVAVEQHRPLRSDDIH